MWIYPTIAAAAVSFFAGWYVNGLRLNAEIAQLHATWNEAYANQSKITMDKEHALNRLNTQIEVDNANQEKAINDAHDKNIKLAADVKRLQQSARTSGSTLPSANNSCYCASETAASEFSNESVRLLVQMAREADEAARYANTCHQWATGVTQELDKQ
ncbi:MAG: hypothetical protein JHC38_00875 [Thiotrichales bacterium]|nr:hypothetical protein [Thiotrichales bacterium]